MDKGNIIHKTSLVFTGIATFFFTIAIAVLALKYTFFQYVLSMFFFWVAFWITSGGTYDKAPFWFSFVHSKLNFASLVALIVMAIGLIGIIFYGTI
jgi:hypothetical protein